MHKTVLFYMLRLTMAGVFLAAALPKIIDPAGFALAVYRYQALPDFAVNLVAVYLPWLELVVALGLLFHPRWRPAAAIMVVFMMLLFIFAQGQAMARGIDVACGCFSTDPGSKQVGWYGIGLNVVLTMAGMLLVLLEHRKAKRDQASQETPDP